MLDPGGLFLDLNTIFMRILEADAQFQKLQATGKSLAFLKSDSSVKISGNSFIKLGLSYTHEQDKGFKYAAPIEPLTKWVLLGKYGIQAKNLKDARQIAFSIARAQKRRGSFKYRNPTEIYSTAAKAAISEFKTKLTDAYIAKLNTIA